MGDLHSEHTRASLEHFLHPSGIILNQFRWIWVNVGAILSQIGPLWGTNGSILVHFEATRGQVDDRCAQSCPRINVNTFKSGFGREILSVF